jgi:hypothetical protein
LTEAEPGVAVFDLEQCALGPAAPPVRYCRIAGTANHFSADRHLTVLREARVFKAKVMTPRRLETFRHTPENDWLLHEFLPGCGECGFPALNASIPFDKIFENAGPQAE